jgi:hypothetical protein
VITYRVTFRVGDDRETVLTTVTTVGEWDLGTLHRKIAAASITSPHQFPASAVRILSIRPV